MASTCTNLLSSGYKATGPLRDETKVWTGLAPFAGSRKTPPSCRRPSWQHSLPRGPFSTFKDITATCVCDGAATSVHSDPPASLTYKDPVMTVDLPGQSRRLSPSFAQSYVPSPFATPSNTSTGSRDQDTDICGPRFLTAVYVSTPLQ